jgi:eukaryotic-like serine/threonine-protein kinase
MPTVIGRYEIVQRLGQGGMAALYLARDPAIDRLVAIKLLREGFDTQELRERFAREARSAGRLRHVNIVTIFDVGEHDGEPFIAMEYIPGETLAELIRRRAPLSIHSKLGFAEDLCAGLGYAHAAGIVHRDIKPANIMVDPDGTLKILDFGIARAGESSMTQAGMIVGTLNYMSPEQVAGVAVDHRSDIFAVGAVLYELLCYQQAFPGNIQSGVLHRILHVEPPSLADLVPGLDPAVPRIVTRALEKDPARRYQDLQTIRKEIGLARQRTPAESSPISVEGETIVVLPPPQTPPSQTPSPQTPPARTMPRRGTDQDLLAKRRALEVDRHLRQAQAALEAGDYPAAVAACEQTLLLDPEHDHALELLDRARTAIERAQVKEWLAQARAELDQGHLDQASKLAEQALAVEAGSAEATDLQRAIERAREERQRVERAGQLTVEATDRLRDGSPESAIRLANEALALDSSHIEARDALQRAQTALADQQREQEERRARKAVEQATAQFAKGQRDEALALLRSFTPAHPVVSSAIADLESQARQIEQQRRAEEEARRRADEERRARKAVEEATARFAKGQRDDALASLRSFAPPHPVVASAIEDLESQARQIEQQRRAEEEARRRAEAEREAREREFAATLASAQSAIDAGRFDDALRALDRARQIEPRAGQTGPLVEKATAGRQAQERAKEARRQFEAALAAASQALASHDLPAAQARLAKALALDARDSAALQLQRQLTAAIEEAEAHARRQREIEAQLAEASRLLAAANFPAALEHVNAVLAVDPRDAAGVALCQRITKAIAENEARERKAIEEAQARERKLAETIARAKAADSHQKAIEMLRAALAIEPGHEQARAMLADREAALERERAEKQRAQEEGRLLAGIHRALKKREWQRADDQLRDLIALAPNHPDVPTLRAAIETGRATQPTARMPVAASAAVAGRGQGGVRRWSPARIAAGTSVAALALVAGILVLSYGRHPAPPSVVSQPTAPLGTTGFDKSAAPASSPTEPGPTVHPAAPSAPPTEATLRLDALRRMARQQVKRGENEKALGTVLSGLALQADDPALEELLGDIVRSSGDRALRARDKATQAGAPGRSPADTPFSQGSETMKRATALEHAGKRDEAVRLYVSAEELFKQAESSAMTAAAAAAQPGQRGAPAGAPPATRQTDRPVTPPPAPPAQPGATAQGREQPQPEPPSPKRPTQMPPPLPAVTPPASSPYTSGSTAEGRRVEPPVAPAPPRPAVVDEEAGVEQALGAYKSAYEHLDVAAVRRIQPSLTAEQAGMLEKAFGDYRSYKVEIDGAHITVNGSKATVSCRVTRRFDPKAGRPGGNTIATVFYLEKSGASWVITRVEAHP